MPYLNPDRQRAYARDWIRRRRADWMAANGPCRQCGSWDRLEVDHIDPAQKVTHAVWSWSDERRAVELAKCQPLCHECHKAKTIAQIRRDPGHGTRARYNRGCKCDDCRRANTEYARRRPSRLKSTVGHREPSV